MEEATTLAMWWSGLLPIALLPIVKAAPVENVGKEPDENVFASLIILFIVLGLLLLVLISIGMYFLAKYLFDHSQGVKLDHAFPGALDDEFEIEERLAELSPNEQHLYRNGQEFIANNPPYNQELSLSNHLLIQEKGIEAWEFIPDPGLESTALYINNKTELNFNSFDYQCSIQTNLPIPKINDVYYFEAKLYQLDSPDDTIVSIGLSTKPYPYFRLPGRHLYSIAYDSIGSRRFSNSFKLNDVESSIFPALHKGDVVGIGYRVRSGTIFFTRNGKKLSEKAIGGHVKGMKMPNIFPTIGANNPCSIHVNLGQAGYVFIEANIKKWGYAGKEGNMPPLPEYGFSSNDLLLESSNEDDEDEIINPPSFFEGAAYQSGNSSFNDDITLNTLPAEPPVYIESNDILLELNTTTNQFLDNDDDDDDDINEDQYEENTSEAVREATVDSQDTSK